MTRIEETNDKSMNEHIFLCDCRDGDYLHLCWDLYDENFRWLSIVHNGTCRTWRSRAKAVWSIIKGEDHLWGNIALDETTVDSLLNTLKECRNLGKEENGTLS